MITAVEVTDKDMWEDFVATQEDANFLQSWYWGEFHKKLGKTVERVGLFNRENNLVGVMVCVVEAARRGRYLTAAGGPLIDWNNKELVAAAVQGLKETAKRHQCAFVRIRPQALETPEIMVVLSNAGFKKSPMHLTADLTNQLDLSPSEDELLANMRKTTRYEIRKAEKENLRVETSLNVEDLREFYDIQIETAKRQGFVPFSYEFLSEQFKVFSEAGSALLYKAYHEKTLLAEAFVIFYGNEAVYHYGASTDEGRRHPGAYLIQWEAIKEAKKRGIKRYNFWGVVPMTETQHRFFGVSVFKRGFGGHEVQYVPAQDLVIDPLRYSLNAAVETVRRKVRKLD
ncbi:peptidoglycan bridge formation glycyltransferase FemA/FemB family protein [Candidatus Microgenomates bacterium]|nr:peptidoglycan bridge formation glycyltransferase FemA/FemB family protein [Candidatus Microgenomates bacterium]